MGNNESNKMKKSDTEFHHGTSVTLNEIMWGLTQYVPPTGRHDTCRITRELLCNVATEGTTGWTELLV
jgi:hypothetical protein